MKLVLHCRDCTEIHGPMEGGVVPENREVMFVELRDDGLYDVTCSQGHRNILALSNLKFEVLFQSGAMALLDGYVREAVSSIAAALERFYEFYIRVMLLKHDIPPQDLERTWKMVSSQSERQVGAFFFMYLLENKRAVSFIPDKYVKFRNDVIHKGYIPTSEEVISYGEQVLTFIFSISKELNAGSNEFVRRMLDLDSGKIAEKYRGLPYSKRLSSTIINLSMHARGFDLIFNSNPNVDPRDPFGKTTFRQALDDLRKELEEVDHRLHNWA
jgi:hypothetical protein